MNIQTNTVFILGDRKAVGIYNRFVTSPTIDVIKNHGIKFFGHSASTSDHVSLSASASIVMSIVDTAKRATIESPNSFIGVYLSTFSIDLIFSTLSKELKNIGWNCVLLVEDISDFNLKTQNKFVGTGRLVRSSEVFTNNFIHRIENLSLIKKTKLTFDKNDKILVIGDVHECIDELKQLLFENGV